MGSLKRKTVTRPLPQGAELFTKAIDGKPVEFARWTPTKATTRTDKVVTAADGTKRIRTHAERTAEVVTAADGTKRIRTHAKTYIAKYRDHQGRLVEASTGCRDRDGAKRRLKELEDRADRIRRGIVRPEEVEIETFQTVPIAQHIAEYLQDLRGRGVNADRIKTSETYLTRDAKGCGFRLLRDLNAEKLRRWLRSHAAMSAATYNWHSTLWVAFGGWLTGKRIDGKRGSLTGERRLSVNPFDGFGKKDEHADRRRVARALTVDELRRLLDHARRRPLEDAMRVTRGPNAGAMTARVTPDRRAKLERLGLERALIYKTAILTGLRLNELRTLRVGDLSFGDVPFIALRAANEKNRKGSSVPLRADLAAELREWTRDKKRGDEVFTVPAGLLRIMNRDLIAAGIDKVNERGGRVHLHALRHSTGTHLSAANVAPRTAQAVMRHSDIALTMNTYTDERLLDAAGAVERLPDLPIGPAVGADLVAPDVAPNWGNRGRNWQDLANGGGYALSEPDMEKPQKTRGFRGFSEIGATGFEPATSASRTQRDNTRETRGKTGESANLSANLSAPDSLVAPDVAPTADNAWRDCHPMTASAEPLAELMNIAECLEPSRLDTVLRVARALRTHAAMTPPAGTRRG